MKKEHDMKMTFIKKKVKFIQKKMTFNKNIR